MGEVYRARDTRLGRTIALKVLPDSLIPDPEQLARFRREAQILAALNHPHIAAVYGLEEADGRLAIGLELVEGEGLDERLARGPVPLEEAIGIMRQTAEGLEAAHERGVVHRDLKPANVRLTRDGSVKLLDFGLAKAWEPEQPGAGSASNAPTLAPHSTSAGMILGTAAYMAPEQARGLPLDKRADIWAFGVVFYELLAGRRPFEGETLGDTLAAVLTHDPDLRALPAATPAGIRTLVSRCLQRDVKSRLRDIGEARIALATPVVSAADSLSSANGQGNAGLRRWVPLAGIALIALIAGAAAGSFAPWPASRPVSNSELLTLGIDAGGDTTIAGVGWVGLNWVGPTAILSPDGQVLVFIARGASGGRWQLYARRLDELKARALAGTEGAYAPFFSPDGSSVGFFAGGQLLRVALDGGTVTPVCPAEEARGGAWSQDGTIVFAPRPEGPLFSVRFEGGAPSQLTTLDGAAGETTHRWPQVLPGSNTVIFTAHAESGRAGSVMAQTTDGRRSVLHRGGLFGRYAASGHLLYLNEGKLFAAPFDVNALAVTGRAVPVVDEVAHTLLSGTAQYSFSNTGLLTYRRARSRNRVLEWMDPSGQQRPLRGVATEYQEARFSPDGGRLLLVIGEGSQSDVWVYDIARDAMTRLTFHADNDWAPIWSPGGTHVAYSSWRPEVGTFNLFLQRASGGGEPQRLTTSKSRQLTIEWHPDGRHILFSEERPGTGSDLLLLPIELTPEGIAKTGAPQALLKSPSNELAGEFSPDGKWLAYTSDQTGRNEVYVQPFPGPGGRWQISTEGAEWVEWRPKGQLFYGRSEEVVMRVPYRIDGSTFVAEKPHVWMRIPPGVSWVDPSPDGTRAAAIRSEDARPESMVLVVNFFEHLRRTAPVAR
jgi:serine/threonine-protein kinase